jgi:hypothetical protein
MTDENKTDERRHFPRMDVKYAAAIVATDGSGLNADVTCVIVNMSKEGMCLKTTLDAPVAAFISVSIDCAGHDSLMLAQVMWRKATGNVLLYGLKIKNWSYLDAALDRALRNASPKSASTPSRPFPQFALGL